MKRSSSAGTCGCAQRAHMSGRTLVALIVAVVLIPVAALATPGAFSSSSGTQPGVTSTNSAPSGVGVFGFATAWTGAGRGVEGRTSSLSGFGVYSQGNLGVSAGRKLVCAGCVTKTDLAPAGFADGVDGLDMPGFTRTVIDTSGTYNTGYDTSITIGADGLGLTSFFGGPTNNLKVAHCTHAACTSSTTATIDSAANNVGGFTSIAIGRDDLGLISYHSSTLGALRVAHCSNRACSTATKYTIDDSGADVVGQHTSITIGTDGLGLISYRDVTNGALKVAHCNNVLCSSATTATIDTVDALWSSITIGSDGLGLISYHDDPNSTLKTAHCNNVACSTATTTTLDASGATGFQTSITIGSDGFGLISYSDLLGDTLNVAHCVNIPCNTAGNFPVDTVASGDSFSSITIGADGLGLIGYRDNVNGDIRVAHCDNVQCLSSTRATVDAAQGTGQYTSITIGADGRPLISYGKIGSPDQFKIAHCSNVFCVPYWRRR